MEITPANLKAFHAWMTRRGRAEGTADLYVKNLRACGKERSLTARLVDGKLAPLSRRTNKAALIAWARFTKDADLHEAVLEVRLPPARRVAIKVPLPTDDWRKVVKRLGTCKLSDDKLRHVCLLIARRGLRVSDALRIRRTEVVLALRTGILSFVGKGAKRHEYSIAPIRAQLEELSKLHGWETVRDLVCPGAKNPTSASNRIRRAFQTVNRYPELKIDKVNPHRFRHTYATNFLEQLRGDPRAIIKLQDHMGWASLNTAALYAASVDKDELSAAGDAMVDRLLADAE